MMFVSFKYSILVVLCCVLLPLSTATAQNKKVGEEKPKIQGRGSGETIKPPALTVQTQNPKALLGAGQRIVAKDLDPKIIASLPKTFRGVRPYKVPPIRVRPAPATPKFLVDLRPFISDHQLFIRSQGSRGTCSVFATTFSLEYALTKSYGAGFADLSEEFLNGAANLVSGKTDDGDFFYVLDNGYQKYGVCMEIFMPYQATMADPPNANQQKLASVWKRLTPDFIKPWDNSKGATDSQFKKAIDYLDRGLPVAVGLWWPKDGSFSVNTIHGVDLISDPGKANMLDGHSVSLVGYGKSPDFPGGGLFVFRNSWGVEFGDQGYGYLSFDYVKKYANDLLVYQQPTE